MTNEPDRPVYSNDREWTRGVWLIACITCVPMALLAIARLLVG